MALLEAKRLSKYFPNTAGMLHAVDEVDFEIEAGRTLGVVGESGCGKSTLGRVILKMIDSTSGEMWFDGKEITGLFKRDVYKLRTKMQMIFQDPFSSIDPRMSITQTIEEPLIIHKLEKNKEERKKKVNEIMDLVGIASRYANAYPHELDGGRRQRVGIARALAVDPTFIVCDEPVSALDVSIQAQILNLLQDIQKERNLTYMFISHNLSVVKYMSDDICVMYLGQIVEKSTTEEFFKETLHPYSQALLSAILVPDIDVERNRIILNGELSSPINPGNLCRFAPRCIYADDECFKSCPKLRDVGGGHFVRCHKVKEERRSRNAVNQAMFDECFSN